MSKFSNLPKRVLDSISRVEKKIVTYPVDDKIKRFKEKFQNLKENRELIVVDKFGNRYYQYYSYHGLPTRRVVVHNLKGFNKWDDDPIMLGWLQKQRINPPSQEELEKLYIQTEELQRRGLEWDRKEQKMIDEWKKRQYEAVEKERKETKAIGDGENFEPGVWERKKFKAENTQQEQIEHVKELTVSNQIVEVKDEDKKVIEGMSSIPGKYIMDFNEDDKKWMEKQRQKALQPYLEIAKDIEWSKYTYDVMVEKGNKENLEFRHGIQKKQQELTNIGKRMLEKKETYQTYSNFRERFKDVFNDPKFSAI